MSIRKEHFARVNRQVRAHEVRLINVEGKMLGVKPIQEALREAENVGLDLIEVAPSANPPVCKIGNYSKYLYEKEKKSKEARKNRSAGTIKEIRFRLKIGEHDFIVKLNQILRFLDEHHKVRVSCIFYGREMQYRGNGQKMIDRIAQAIQGKGIVEQAPQMYGNRLITILVPHKG